MGSYGAGGTGSKGPVQTIAAGQITVPERIWKAIVVLEKGENDGQHISPATRIIAVNAPNDNAAVFLLNHRLPWQQFTYTPYRKEGEKASNGQSDDQGLGIPDLPEPGITPFYLYIPDWRYRHAATCS
jgi:hypothetical protein